MDRFDREIARALQAGHALEKQSDDYFACGDIIGGSKAYRDAVLCYLRAENIARRAAATDRVRFGCLTRM